MNSADVPCKTLAGSWCSVDLCINYSDENVLHSHLSRTAYELHFCKDGCHPLVMYCRIHCLYEFRLDLKANEDIAALSLNLILAFICGNFPSMYCTAQCSVYDRNVSSELSSTIGFSTFNYTESL